jgi:hypothetical protein
MLDLLVQPHERPMVERPVRAVRDPPGLIPPRGHPVVLGRTVHWLCVWRSVLSMLFSVIRYVLAVDVDAAVATEVQLPVDLRDSSGLLLGAVGGRLSLLAVDEHLEVSVWTLTATTPAAAWSRDLVIRALEMERQAGRLHSPVKIQGFGRGAAPWYGRRATASSSGSTWEPKRRPRCTRRLRDVSSTCACTRLIWRHCSKV